MKYYFKKEFKKHKLHLQEKWSKLDPNTLE